MSVRRDRVVHPLLFLVPFAKPMLSRHELLIVVPHLICATLSLSLDQCLKALDTDSLSSSHSAGGVPPPPLLCHANPPAPIGCCWCPSPLVLVPLLLDSLRPPSFPQVSDHLQKPCDVIFRNCLFLILSLACCFF